MRVESMWCDGLRECFIGESKVEYGWISRVDASMVRVC